ncbi:zinc c3hc4 type (ring finger) domain-containing, partial [Cystoisospora suis]
MPGVDRRASGRTWDEAGASPPYSSLAPASSLSSGAAHSTPEALRFSAGAPSREVATAQGSRSAEPSHSSAAPVVVVGVDLRTSSAGAAAVLSSNGSLPAPSSPVLNCSSAGFLDFPDVVARVSSSSCPPCALPATKASSGPSTVCSSSLICRRRKRRLCEISSLLALDGPLLPSVLATKGRRHSGVLSMSASVQEDHSGLSLAQTAQGAQGSAHGGDKRASVGEQGRGGRDKAELPLSLDSGREPFVSLYEEVAQAAKRHRRSCDEITRNIDLLLGVILDSKAAIRAAAVASTQPVPALPAQAVATGSAGVSSASSVGGDDLSSCASRLSPERCGVSSSTAAVKSERDTKLSSPFSPSIPWAPVSPSGDRNALSSQVRSVLDPLLTPQNGEAVALSAAEEGRSPTGSRAASALPAREEKKDAAEAACAATPTQQDTRSNGEQQTKTLADLAAADFKPASQDQRGEVRCQSSSVSASGATLEAGEREAASHSVLTGNASAAPPSDQQSRLTSRGIFSPGFSPASSYSGVTSPGGSPSPFPPPSAAASPFLSSAPSPAALGPLSSSSLFLPSCALPAPRVVVPPSPSASTFSLGEPAARDLLHTLSLSSVSNSERTPSRSAGGAAVSGVSASPFSACSSPSSFSSATSPPSASAFAAPVPPPSVKKAMQTLQQKVQELNVGNSLAEAYREQQLALTGVAKAIERLIPGDPAAATRSLPPPPEQQLFFALHARNKMKTDSDAASVEVEGGRGRIQKVENGAEPSESREVVEGARVEGEEGGRRRRRTEGAVDDQVAERRRRRHEERAREDGEEERRDLSGREEVPTASGRGDDSDQRVREDSEGRPPETDEHMSDVEKGKKTAYSVAWTRTPHSAARNTMKVPQEANLKPVQRLAYVTGDEWCTNGGGTPPSIAEFLSGQADSFCARRQLMESEDMLLAKLIALHFLHCGWFDIYAAYCDRNVCCAFYLRSAEQQHIFDSIECPCPQCTRSRSRRSVVEHSREAVEDTAAFFGPLGALERAPGARLGCQAGSTGTLQGRGGLPSLEPVEEGAKIVALLDEGPACGGETSKSRINSTSDRRNGSSADGKEETLPCHSSSPVGSVAASVSGAPELLGGAVKCVACAPGVESRRSEAAPDPGELNALQIKAETKRAPGDGQSQKVGKAERTKKPGGSCDQYYEHTGTGGRVRLLPKEVEAAYVQLHEILRRLERTRDEQLRQWRWRYESKEKDGVTSCSQKEPFAPPSSSGGVKKNGVDLALHWLERQKKHHRRRLAPLHFELHKLKFLSLLSSPSSTVEQALHYSRMHLTPFWRMHKADVCRLMGCVAFFGRRETAAPASSETTPGEHVTRCEGDNKGVLEGSEQQHPDRKISSGGPQDEKGTPAEEGLTAVKPGAKSISCVDGVSVQHAVSGKEGESGGTVTSCTSFSSKVAARAESTSSGRRKEDRHVDKNAVTPLLAASSRPAAAQDRSEKRLTCFALASLGEGTPYKDLVSEAVWARVLNLFRKAFCETGLLLPVCRHPPLGRDGVSSSCAGVCKLSNTREGLDSAADGLQDSTLVPALTMPPSSLLSRTGTQPEGWRTAGGATGRSIAARAAEVGERRARRSVLDSTELIVELDDTSREDSRQQRSARMARGRSSFLPTSQDDERHYHQSGPRSARGRLVTTTFHLPGIEDRLGGSCTARSTSGDTPASLVRLILCPNRYGPTRPLGEGVSVSGRSVSHQERFDEELRTIADASAVTALTAGSGAHAAVAAVARSGARQLGEAVRAESNSLLSDVPLSEPVVSSTLYLRGEAKKKQRDCERLEGPNWLRDCVLAPFSSGVPESDVSSAICLPPLGTWSIRGQRFSRCRVNSHSSFCSPDNREVPVSHNNCCIFAKEHHSHSIPWCPASAESGGRRNGIHTSGSLSGGGKTSSRRGSLSSNGSKAGPSSSALAAREAASRATCGRSVHKKLSPVSDFQSGWILRVHALTGSNRRAGAPRGQTSVEKSMWHRAHIGGTGGFVGEPLGQIEESAKDSTLEIGTRIAVPWQSEETHEGTNPPLDTDNASAQAAGGDRAEMVPGGLTFRGDAGTPTVEKHAVVRTLSRTEAREARQGGCVAAVLGSPSLTATPSFFSSRARERGDARVLSPLGNTKEGSCDFESIVGLPTTDSSHLSSSFASAIRRRQMGTPCVTTALDRATQADILPALASEKREIRWVLTGNGTSAGGESQAASGFSSSQRQQRRRRRELVESLWLGEALDSNCFFGLRCRSATPRSPHLCSYVLSCRPNRHFSLLSIQTGERVMKTGDAVPKNTEDTSSGVVGHTSAWRSSSRSSTGSGSDFEDERGVHHASRRGRRGRNTEPIFASTAPLRGSEEEGGEELGGGRRGGQGGTSSSTHVSRRSERRAASGRRPHQNRGPPARPAPAGVVLGSSAARGMFWRAQMRSVGSRHGAGTRRLAAMAVRGLAGGGGEGSYSMSLARLAGRWGFGFPVRRGGRREEEEDESEEGEDADEEEDLEELLRTLEEDAGAGVSEDDANDDNWARTGWPYPSDPARGSHQPYHEMLRVRRGLERLGSSHSPRAAVPFSALSQSGHSRHRSSRQSYYGAGGSSRSRGPSRSSSPWGQQHSSAPL